MRKFFVLLILVLVPALALAVPKETATYKAVKSHGANAKLIEKGIEGAVADMSFITRPIARRKLTKSNIAFKSITLKFPGKKVSIQHDDRKPVDSKADGSKSKWTREDGEVFTVSQKVSDQEIVQIFFADEGVKTLKYVFNEDFSKMTMHVKLESPKLAAPLKYKLDYAK
jgi:hypothetical protein